LGDGCVVGGGGPSPPPTPHPPQRIFIEKTAIPTGKKAKPKSFKATEKKNIGVSA